MRKLALLSLLPASFCGTRCVVEMLRPRIDDDVVTTGLASFVRVEASVMLSGSGAAAEAPNCAVQVLFNDIFASDSQRAAVVSEGSMPSAIEQRWLTPQSPVHFRASLLVAEPKRALECCEFIVRCFCGNADNAGEASLMYSVSDAKRNALLAAVELQHELSAGGKVARDGNVSPAMPPEECEWSPCLASSLLR
jgi:hypothetical protein